jgi:hypothetical protein
MSIVDRISELPDFLNGESLEEFKKRAMLTPESDVPAYLKACLARLSHLFPPREKLEEAIRSLLAETEAEAGQQAEQGKHEGSCDLCGYQFDAERREERCFCYHLF